jgi:hypothetical protein
MFKPANYLRILKADLIIERSMQRKSGQQQARWKCFLADCEEQITYGFIENTKSFS